MAPPLHPLGGPGPGIPRVSVLVCDSCDAVMDPVGRGTTEKKHADSDPTDLAPHYENETLLTSRATHAGWTNEGDRWWCPKCHPTERPPRR